MTLHGRTIRARIVLFFTRAKYNNGMNTNVYKNATLVTGLSVAERTLGFLYRIVLSRLIGAEGLGLYQVALSFFSLFLTVGTGGIPITVSRMVSKSNAENDPLSSRRVVSAGVVASLCLTLPVCLFFFLFGKRLPFLFSDARTFDVFKILLLGLCFSSVYAVFRGYFWGNKNFLTPSILELAEETVMVVFGVLLLRGVQTPLSGATRASYAVLISYLFSFTASLTCFLVKNGRFSSPKKALKPLFNASLPITSVRASGSLVNSAIAVLLPVMLIRAGLTHADATATFGVVSGMVLPVLFIPSTLIGSMALVLVPELSEDFYKKNTVRLTKNIERGLRFSFLVSCALIPFFFALGEDFGRIAFSNADAGRLIKISAPILMPMCLTMITTSMLNSMGFEKQTLAFYFVGAGSLLLCVLFLPGVCGIYAYLIGLFLSFLLTALCNLIFLFKQCPVYKNLKKEGKSVLLPCLIATLLSSLFGTFSSGLLKSFFGEITALIFTGACILFFSLAFLFACGVLPASFRKPSPKKQNAKIDKA